MNETKVETKETFDEIWAFIEEKLKTPIPVYFKYILKYCGYNNGITIATIDDNDVQYFVGEVRNGNVSNYFKRIIGEKNVLKGSTKTIENFEFSRGHMKFLTLIVTFLKKHIEENGPEFTMEVASKTRKQKLSYVPPKRRSAKYSPTENLRHNHEHRPSNTDDMENSIQKQNRILVSKMLMSLKTHTKVLYAENANIINNKISTQLVIVKEIEFEDKSEDKSSKLKNLEESSEKVVPKAVRKYTAKLYCPYCAKSINVFYVTSGSPRWNSSNFDRHLISNHVESNDKKTLDKEATGEARDNETPSETRDNNIRVEEIRDDETSNDETCHNENDVIEIICVDINDNGTTIAESGNYPEPSEKSLKGDQRTYRQELDRYVRQGNECGTDENGFDKSSEKSRNIGLVSYRDKEAPREALDNETPSETRNDEIRDDVIETICIETNDNRTTIAENENYPEPSEKSLKGDQLKQCTYRQELDSYVRKDSSNSNNDQGKECQTDENRFDKSNEKSRNIGLRTIVSNPDSDRSHVDEDELQQQEKYGILSELSGGNLKLERNQNFPKSVSKVNEADQNKDNDSLIYPKPGDFVIYSTSIENSKKWPENTTIVKNFVGNVSRIKESIGEIELHVLKKSRYFQSNFLNPETIDVNTVQKDRILKILQAPSQNRRGEFVFKDKVLLDYIFLS